MARLTLTYSSLYTKVSNFLGLTATGTAPTGTDLQTCKDIVDRGVRSFLYPLDESGNPHHWEFLKTYYTLNTVGSQWKYALPIGFSDTCKTFYFDGVDGNPRMDKVDAQQIFNMRSELTEYTGYPTHFAIVPSKYDLSIGTQYEIWFYPSPDQAYTLHTFYILDPVQMSSATDIVIGGVRVAEAILESCLAEAEVQENDEIGIHSQRAEMMIKKAILFDTVTKTDKIGNLYGDKDRRWPPERPLFSYPNPDNVYSDER